MEQKLEFFIKPSQGTAGEIKRDFNWGHWALQVRPFQMCYLGSGNLKKEYGYWKSVENIAKVLLSPYLNVSHSVKDIIDTSESNGSSGSTKLIIKRCLRLN